MMKRLPSIEILKGLGIIYLIGLHEWVWIFLDLSTFQLRYSEMNSIFPLFGYFTLHVFGFEVPLLAGVTYYLSMVKKQSSFVYVLKRALLLLGLGYTVNYLCWGFGGVLDWDALHFIALSMIVSYPVLKFVPKGINIIILNIVGIIALFLSDKFPLSQWAGLYPYEIIIGSQSGSHFWPMCPWYFIFVAGLTIGYVFNGQNKLQHKLLLGTGVLFVISSVFGGGYNPVVTTALWGRDMFKPSFYYILGIVGTSIVWIYMLEYVLKRFSKLGTFLQNSFIILFGRSILWLYLLNTIVGYHVTHWVLNKYSFEFKEIIWVYLGLVMGTYVVGYIIAFAVGQNKKVSYV